MFRIQYIFLNRWLNSWFFYLSGCSFPVSSVDFSSLPRFPNIGVPGKWVQIKKKPLPSVHSDLGDFIQAHALCSDKHKTAPISVLPPKFSRNFRPRGASAYSTPRLGCLGTPPHLSTPPLSSRCTTLQKTSCSFSGLPYLRKGQLNLLLK